MDNNLFKVKHNSWLSILFGSFAIKNSEISNELYEFSTIAFRHLRWISRELKALHVEYNYDRLELNIEHNTTHEFLKSIISTISSASLYYKKSILFERIKTDEHYMLSRLNSMLISCKDETITAFNRGMKYENRELNPKQTSSLVKFLFEESYKEYELILVYAYMQNHTDSIQENDIFQDLIDESQYHLKSFGTMMSKLGILSLPRELHEKTYKIDDVSKFIVDGIKEEEAAKEMCKALSAEVNDKDLSKFFDFINYQESYHIDLMKKLLSDVTH